MQPANPKEEDAVDTRMRSELMKEAAKLRRQGHSLREIAELLGIGKSTIARWLPGETRAACRPAIATLIVVAVPHPAASCTAAEIERVR
jgi:predicted XRE-type DNA-binding protein